MRGTRYLPFCVNSGSYPAIHDLHFIRKFEYYFHLLPSSGVYMWTVIGQKVMA